MLKALFFLYLSSLLLWSASTNNPVEIVGKINTATINALMIFTSQEGLNSGKYTFSNTPVDLKMEIYHLPFLYNFHSSTNLNYFIVGNVGYNRVSLDGDLKSIPGNEEGLNSFNNIKVYTSGIGGGLRYQLYHKLYFSIGAEFIYSRMGISIKSDKPLGGAIEDFFNKNYSDNITYKFFGLVEYRPIFHKYKPYITLGHKVYETKSSFSLEDLSSFHSASSVTSLAIGVETPPLYSYAQDNYLTVETYFNGHALNGVVKNVVKIDKYASIGGVLYWNTLKDPWWTSRFFLEAALISSDGLKGYNLGGGFRLDF